MTQERRTPFTVVEREDLIPMCPHCNEDVPEVYAKARGFPIGQGRTYIYFCPHCRKVIGFAQGRAL